MKSTPLVCAALSFLLTACPSTTGGGGDTEADDGIDVPGSTGTPGGTTSTPPPEDDTTAGGGEGGSTSDDPPDPSAGSTDTGEPGTGSSGSMDTEGPEDVPVDCNGTTYQCGDGIDNDGDGFVDLDDPECTGPCDDDESSFQTGLPGDNMDCKQDCFFDGNSGQGDDGCEWDLNCDPYNPGASFGCPYTGGQACNNIDPPSEQCLMACEPFVPPGCDCFGCCTVQTDSGPVNIFLNSDEDCSLDNLEACGECSPSELCGNPCMPEECELCFGETELPEGCEENTCDFGVACELNSDCNLGEFCYLGCCYPVPAG